MHPNSNFENRRREIRFPCIALKVAWRPMTGVKQWYSGRMYNLSRSGLAFTVDSNLRLRRGELLELRRGLNSVTSHCRVMRTMDGRNDTVLVGCREETTPPATSGAAVAPLRLEKTGRRLPYPSLAA